MHKYSHYIQNSLSEWVLTIYKHRCPDRHSFAHLPVSRLPIFFSTNRFAHSSVSCSPNFFPPIASLFLLFLARQIFSFPSLPRACSQATTDRHMHQNILAKFVKCRCFDFRYIIFGLLKGYLWQNGAVLSVLLF